MTDAKPNPPQGNLQVQLDDDVAEGHYANLVLITHSPVEFVLDFARVVPGSPKAKVQTRVILAAAHAKGLLRALEDNIKKFESAHGEIKQPGSSGTNKFGFQD